MIALARLDRPQAVFQWRGKVMLPCHGCAYATEVPGNAHIACEYAWNPDRDLPLPPRGHPHGVKMGWFYFPVLFDPTWGPDECAARSETRDPAKVAKGGQVSVLAGLLRR